MHPLSTDLNIQDIIGRQLNQVGVGRWDAQFSFDCTRIIQSMGKVEITTGNKVIVVFNGEWLDISPIQDIVGLEVIAWSRLNDHSFSVTLDNNSVITFYTSDVPYEEIIIYPEDWVF